MMEDKELTARLAEIDPQEQPIEQEQQEGAPQEEHDATSEHTDQQQEAAPAVPSQAQQKESGHFKKLREAYEKAEREKEQLYELLFKMQQSQKPLPEVQKQAEPELDDNDYVPRNYVDKRLRETQEQVSQYQQLLYEQMVQNQLQAQYSDFSTVLSKDNIARLRQEHPEIAASLAANPDVATKAQATYKILKKLGIGNEETYEADKKKIQANTQKPRPAVTSPLSYAHDYEYRRMSDDDMARERAEMERAIQGG